MGIILGQISKSRIICESPGREADYVADLDLTNFGQGLVEDYEDRTIEHEAISLVDPKFEETIQIHKGTKIRFIFNYPDWITGEGAIKFKEIWKRWRAGWQIFLIPRLSQPWRRFEVLWDTKQFQITTDWDDLTNKLPIFVLKTRYTVDDWQWELWIPVESTYTGTYLYTVTGNITT